VTDDTVALSVHLYLCCQSHLCTLLKLLDGMAETRVIPGNIISDRGPTSVIFVNENENENEKDQQFVHENEN